MNIKMNNNKIKVEFHVFDKLGNPNGYFLANEEELCKAYCELNDCTYKMVEVRA